MTKARGPITVALLCLVPLVLWAASGPPAPRFADPTTAITSVAVLFGLAGASAFACNLVLGARLRVVDAYFGGLDKVFRFHRRNGEIALALLTCHAVLVVWSRATVSGSAALTLLSPASGWSVFSGVVALALALATLAFTLFARLGHEVFVYVHRLFGAAFAIAALHVFSMPGAPLPVPVTIYLAVLAGAGLLAWVYRSLFSSVLVRRHDYAVAAVNELDPSVVEIAMEPVDRPLRYVPGQFVFVTFYSSTFSAQFHPVSLRSEGQSAVVTLRPGDARDQFHPFSLTSAPTEKRLRVTVKAVGDFTTALRALDAGAAARVEGPYGGFSYLNTPNRRQVWIAGGIGITPFLSMARSLADDGYDIDLYYGCKTRAQAYFADELAAIADGVPGFDVMVVPEDESGLITPAMIEQKSGDLRARDFFICGPPAMIDSLSARLEAEGVPRRQIHFERFALGQPSP